MRSCICIVADERYERPARALLRSLAMHWAGADRPSVAILGPRWGQPSRSRIADAAEHAGCAFSFIEVASDSDLPVRAPWNRSLYSRLTLSESVIDADRVICLDSDMIVLASLHELLQLDLQGAILGAVPDICVEANDLRASATRYFNSGLLVVDLPQWSQARVGQRCRELLMQPGADLAYLDQDALNQVVRGRWVPLDQRWNVFAFDELRQAGELPASLRNATAAVRLDALQRDAWCLHYAGPSKPWVKGYPEGPNRWRYEAYAM